jgi:type IV secretion system protein VirB5
MNEIQPPPPVGPDFNAAKRQYIELYGSVAVMNTYLKLAVASLCLVVVGLIVANVHTVRLFRDFKPLVVRINDIGRAEAVAYEGFAYKPKEAEIKYFLIRFVQQHYGRMRATVKENYGRSLYFLDRQLADAVIEANKKSGLIETFLVDQSDEIDVRVMSVSIEDLRSPPYRATVDFEKIYSARSNRTERKRERYVGNFVFTFRDRVSNEMIPVNPLGFTITYFREDQAF